MISENSQEPFFLEPVFIEVRMKLPSQKSLQWISILAVAHNISMNRLHRKSDKNKYFLFNLLTILPLKMHCVIYIIDVFYKSQCKHKLSCFVNGTAELLFR